MDLLKIKANWAQHAGKTAQKVVLPYSPQTFYKDASFASHPMWSARWGHTIVVINQTSMYRNDKTVEQNSKRAEDLVPEMILLGGDDYENGMIYEYLVCENDFFSYFVAKLRWWRWWLPK